MKLNEKIVVDINGLPLKAHLWGKDETAPIILFVHGGPGLPFRHKIKKYLLPLASDYVLAVIDERGAGGSYSPTLKKEDLTIDNYVKDIHEWAKYLTKRFNHKKVYLVGHSFGSYLVARAALEQPSLYAAIIGVAQALDMDEMLVERYKMLSAKARELRDTALENKLEAMGEPVKGHFKTPEEDKFFHDIYYPMMEPYGYPSYKRREIYPIYRSSEYTLKEKKNLMKSLSFTAEATSLQRSSMVLANYGYVYKVPYYIIQGREDITTPYIMAKNYMEQMRAPKKGLVAYESSGHEPLFQEPQRFMIDIRNRFNEDVD